jgi:hypothetical protein
MTDMKLVYLDLRTADNTLLATTHSRGMFTGTFDTLSISEFDTNDLGIKIYPTVSNGAIAITFNQNLVKTSIQIFNLSGQRVFETEKDLSSNETSVQLDLKSGLYLIQFQSNGRLHTEKIIIK